jgi:hypothetical protein
LGITYDTENETTDASATGNAVVGAANRVVSTETTPARGIMGESVRKLLKPVEFQRGLGDTITLGTCCICGRNVTPAMANKTGGRCRYEGAQYDKTGTLIHDGRRTQHTDG